MILRYFNPVGAHISGEIGEDESVKAKRFKKKKRFDWSSLNPFS